MRYNHTYKFLHPKGNYKQNKKITYIMGENICKWCKQQGLNFQNIQTAHATQKQQKKPSHKVSRGPKWTLLQRRNTDGQQTHEKLLQIRSDQSLSRVWLFSTPWIAAHQASLSITNSRSSLRLTSIESVMPSSHLILCRSLLLLLPIPPSIRVFSNESTLRMRWPKY